MSREAFEKWYSEQDIADPEPDRTYELSEEGLTELCKDTLRMGFDAGYKAATAAANEEIKNLHSVMMAAAVEITEHWDAHCDEEGYGPANLVRRLENCYPAQYGYDAETVVRMEERIEWLEAQLREAPNKRTGGLCAGARGADKEWHTSIGNQMKEQP